MAVCAMRSLLAVLALAAVLSPSPARGGEAAASSLRVVQWNAFYDGTGTDGVRDRGRQVAALAALAPDVVSLNEVTAGAAVDYAARMQRATGARWHHHHAAGARGWGNAILSRHPLLSTSAYLMKVGAARSVAQATLSVNGSRVNVFATHLDSGDRAKSRAAQVEELIAFVNGFAPPRIIAGDMNAGPDAGEIQPLFSAWEDAWLAAVYRGTARSYAANPPHRYTRTRRGRLDYIFVSRDVTALACEVPDLRDRANTAVREALRTRDDEGVRPSDHNLVACALAWEGGPPAGAAGVALRPRARAAAGPGRSPRLFRDDVPRGGGPAVPSQDAREGGARQLA